MLSPSLLISDKAGKCMQFCLAPNLTILKQRCKTFPNKEMMPAYPGNGWNNVLHREGDSCTLTGVRLGVGVVACGNGPTVLKCQSWEVFQRPSVIEWMGSWGTEGCRSQQCQSVMCQAVPSISHGFTQIILAATLIYNSVNQVHGDQLACPKSFNEHVTKILVFLPGLASSPGASSRHVP